jgi:hypothetical protein
MTCSAIAEVISELARQPEQLQRLVAATELKGLLSKLPAELRDGVDCLRHNDPAWNEMILEQAHALLQHAARVQGRS